MATKSKLNKKVTKGMIQSIRRHLKVLSIVPDDIPSWNALGILFGNLNKYARAIKCFQKVIFYEPENIQAYHNTGVTYGRAGDHEKAIEYFKQALEMDAEFAPAWHHSGVSFTQLGQSNKAMECFQVCDMLKYSVNDKNKYAYVVVTNQHPS